MKKPYIKEGIIDQVVCECKLCGREISASTIFLTTSMENGKHFVDVDCEDCNYTQKVYLGLVVLD